MCASRPASRSSRSSASAPLDALADPDGAEDGGTEDCAGVGESAAEGALVGAEGSGGCPLQALKNMASTARCTIRIKSVGRSPQRECSERRQSGARGQGRVPEGAAAVPRSEISGDPGRSMATRPSRRRLRRCSVWHAPPPGTGTRLSLVTMSRTGGLGRGLQTWEPRVPLHNCRSPRRAQRGRPAVPRELASGRRAALGPAVP